VHQARLPPSGRLPAVTAVTARSAAVRAAHGAHPRQDGRGESRDDTAAVRVLICDDHEVYRLGLRAVLEAAEGIALVGEATDPAQALMLSFDSGPDVALVAQHLQGGGALELIRRLDALGTGVVVLADSDARHDLVDALRAGARGYLTRRVAPHRLVDGIRAVARKETALDSRLAGHLLPSLEPPADAVGAPGTGTEPGPDLGDGRPQFPASPAAPPAPSAGSPDPSAGGRPAGLPDDHWDDAQDTRRRDDRPPGTRFQELLTQRQRMVAALVADGLSNAEIAARLYLSPATVKSHLTIILRRLELRDRTQLAILVNRHDHLAAPDPMWG
jgi:DNA-binding NarL/FixJ family response regulator